MVKAVVNPDVPGLGEHTTASGVVVGREPVEVKASDLEFTMPFGGVEVHPIIRAEAVETTPAST